MAFGARYKANGFDIWMLDAGYWMLDAGCGKRFFALKWAKRHMLQHNTAYDLWHKELIATYGIDKMPYGAIGG